MNKLKIIKKIKSYIVISFIVSLCMISCVGDRMKGSGWATPFVNENNVYIGTIEGDLISVDLNTAKENWRASSLDSDFYLKLFIPNHSYLIIKYLLEHLQGNFWDLI